MGTIAYSGPAMGKCYVEKKPMPIDLYYNDLFGLERTIEEFKKAALFGKEEDY